MSYIPTHDPAHCSIALVNLGCRVNRVEIDGIAQELEAAGLSLVPSDDADIIVVNTCGVTGEAEAKTRKTLRHFATRSDAPLVIATGCVANLIPKELEELAPNILVERQKSKVAPLILEHLGLTGAGGEAPAHAGFMAPTPTGRTRPGIKIQDGCDNRCSYCIVWKARGPARSVAADEVIASIEAAVARGAKEVVLTGINLGTYDSGGYNLAQLLELILDKTFLNRVRLSSIEPPDVNRELLELMAAHQRRIAPFLHICLQSGSDATLERMGRVYDTAFYRSVVTMARRLVPNLSLGTDIIVGFPGEDEQEFAESLSFCEEMFFSKMHVFRYSKRPGTVAAEASGQVAPECMAQRARMMRELASRMRLEQARALVGTEQDVLVQAPGRAITAGLFDCQVNSSLATDSFVRVRIASALDDATLIGLGARDTDELRLN